MFFKAQTWLKRRQFKQPPSWKLLLGAICLAYLGGVGSQYIFLQPQIQRSFSEGSATASTNAGKPAAINTLVTGLGRLEPQGEVINLSAPPSAEGVRVKKLLVEEGDWVRAGQTIAVLDNYNTRLAALSQAKEQLKVAQARLAKVKAGAQTGTLAAQKATIARLQAELRGEIPALQATIDRLQAELNNAVSEYQRHQSLFRQGAISASLMDSKRLPVDTLQKQLNEARANLQRTRQSYQEQIRQARSTLTATAEVRPVDVRVAQAEVDSARATIQQAQANLELSSVRAPIAGQVLEVHTRTGEVVHQEGIVELGRTHQMYAVVEVYETDIARVQLGQTAIIRGAAFSGELKGVVAEIGRLVSRQRVLSTNPLEDTDQKVIKVKVRITPSQENRRRIENLTNLQVQVSIKT
jgi:HlyD family secretion protein